MWQMSLYSDVIVVYFYVFTYMSYHIFQRCIVSRNWGYGEWRKKPFQRI